jgi:hypothetical protein
MVMGCFLGHSGCGLLIHPPVLQAIARLFRPFCRAPCSQPDQVDLGNLFEIVFHRAGLGGALQQAALLGIESFRQTDRHAQVADPARPFAGNGFVDINRAALEIPAAASGDDAHHREFAGAH